MRLSFEHRTDSLLLKLTISDGKTLANGICLNRAYLQKKGIAERCEYRLFHPA
ncbi:hypothetical protein EDF82_1694 [Raoultella sp. BIGb0399]|nr:hypothetical protein EDF82_1694 [Raoultella sp. BIGb0399]